MNKEYKCTECGTTKDVHSFSTTLDFRRRSLCSACMEKVTDEKEILNWSLYKFCSQYKNERDDV